jgi:arginyl-tRNA synthetase
MKSREGKVVEADDLISEMERLAKEAVLARNKDLTPSDLAERARIIAQAALKFFFLKIGPKQNTTFYPDQSIVFEGDTGPYLLYTYARIKSLIDKDENIKNSFQAGNFDFSILVEPLEREIAARLSIFSEIIKQAAFDYNPSLLVEYLLKLSQKFNEFYHAYPVLKAENKLVLSRLALAQAVSQVVKNGLTILGIETLDRM